MIECDRCQELHYLDTQTGKRYPSVSQILNVLYGNRFSRVPADVLAESQARGVRRHLLFGLLILNYSKLAPLPQIEPRDKQAALGMRDWIVRNNVTAMRVEDPALNTKEGYGGTPDAKVLFGPRRRITIPDLKTGGIADAHRVQVQLYAKLDGYTDAQDLMDLYVDDEGKVREEPIERNAHDWAWAMAGVQVLKGRIARGIK